MQQQRQKQLKAHRNYQLESCIGYSRKTQLTIGHNIDQSYNICVVRKVVIMSRVLVLMERNASQSGQSDRTQIYRIAKP